MKNGVLMFSFFALGAGAGAAGTALYMRKNYVKKSEAESEKQDYLRMKEELLKERQDLQDEKKKIFELNESTKAKIMDIYNSGMANFGYVEEVFDNANANLKAVTESNESNIYMEPREDEDEKDIPQFATLEPNRNVQMPEPVREDIYLITEEEFGNHDDYDVIDLTFYNNGVVTDMVGEIVEDPESLIGDTILDILPTYADSGFLNTYVRNDTRRTDYEIDLAGHDFLDS